MKSYPETVKRLGGINVSDKEDAFNVKFMKNHEIMKKGKNSSAPVQFVRQPVERIGRSLAFHFHLIFIYFSGNMKIHMKNIGKTLGKQTISALRKQFIQENNFFLGNHVSSSTVDLVRRLSHEIEGARTIFRKKTIFKKILRFREI